MILTESIYSIIIASEIAEKLNDLSFFFINETLQIFSNASWPASSIIGSTQNDFSLLLCEKASMLF